MPLNIKELQEICCLENIEITMHAAKRLEQGGITTDDLLSCIMHGSLIEQYPEDYPLPSCLILGTSIKNQFLHVVVGSDLKKLWIVTAYYPSSVKWENDFKTRMENRK